MSQLFQSLEDEVKVNRLGHGHAIAKPHLYLPTILTNLDTKRGWPMTPETEFLSYAKSREFLIEAFFSFRQGVVIADSEGTILLANPSAKELLGIENQMTQADYLQLFDLYSLDTMQPLSLEMMPLTRAASQGDFSEMEISIRPVMASDSRSVVVEGTQLREGEALLGSIVTFRDITQSRLKERERDEARIESINASKLSALGALASEIAHEMAHPISRLATTSSMIQTMIGEEDSLATIRNQLVMMDQYVHQLETVLASLKNISRNSLTESIQECRLHDILSDVYSLCFTKLKHKKIFFDIDFDEPLLQNSVTCGRIQVSEILHNLILNAIDAIEDMEGPWIRLEVKEFHHHYEFRISDSGPGVPPEIQEKVFEPFFTTKPLGKGSGLGLSLSRDYIRRQGGDLWIDQHAHVSSFVLSLPILRLN
jgi:signal transduction histidine kinase